MGHNLHGDVSVEDLALANELASMETHLDKNMDFYGPSTAARVLVCLSHDFYELGDDDKGRELLEKADKICPGYFENKIKDHIEQDPDFAVLVDSLADKIMAVAKSVIDGK